MKVKAKTYKPYYFLVPLLVLTALLLSLKSVGKKGSKYPTVPEIAQTTPLDFIQISLNEKQYNKLKKKRNKAVSTGILETSDTDYVPATVSYNGKNFKAEIRLKGDWTDHLEGDKWSFRIKLKDDKTILGMRKFSIHHPRTRGNINEWLYHKTVKKEELIGLRYNFIEGAIHVKKENSGKYISKNLGIYALEESFDKRTIENNKRKESVILKFSEDYYWQEVKKATEVGAPYGVRWNKFMNGQIDLLDNFQITPFAEEKTLSDSIMSKYFKLGKNLLEDIRRGDTTIDKVFNVKELALHNAIVNLFGAVHSTYSINLRFFYNPITSRLEPMAFDGNAGARLQKYAHFIFADEQKDSVYFKELARAINKVIQPAYLNEIISEHKKELDYFQAVLNKEFKGKMYRVENFKFNQDIMRNELLRLKQKYNLTDINVSLPELSGKIEYDLPEPSKWQNKSLIFSPQNSSLLNEKVYSLSRKDTTTSGFVNINKLNVSFGERHRVSIVVKKDLGDYVGLRMQGVYPNRIDAVFNIDKGTVAGQNKQGPFEDEKVSIKPLGNGWYECSIEAKLNLSQLNIIIGPTDGSQRTTNWEAKNTTNPKLFIVPGMTVLKKIKKEILVN